MPEIEPNASPPGYKVSDNAAIEEILRLKNPMMLVTQGLYDIARGMSADMAPTPVLLAIQAQRDGLMALDADALAQLLQQERDRYERSQFYNVPLSQVDIDLWSRLDAWTQEEAVALLLGRDPARVSWAKIKSRNEESAFVRLYQRLLQIVQRATPLQPGDRLDPATVLAWGQEQHGLKPPEHLVSLVNARAKRFAHPPQQPPSEAPPANEIASGTPKRWTAEKVEELRLYYEEHGPAAAGKKFGITPQRVGQVLARRRQQTRATVFSMGKPVPK